jgi:hypothetical protein
VVPNERVMGALETRLTPYGIVELIGCELEQVKNFPVIRWVE